MRGAELKKGWRELTQQADKYRGSGNIPGPLFVHHPEIGDFPAAGFGVTFRLVGWKRRRGRAGAEWVFRRKSEHRRAEGVGWGGGPPPRKGHRDTVLDGKGGGEGGGRGGVGGGAWVGWRGRLGGRGWGGGGGGGANAKKTQKNAKKMQKNAKKKQKTLGFARKMQKIHKTPGKCKKMQKNTKLMQHTVMPVLPGRRRLVAFLLHFFCICFRASAAGQHGVANILQTLSLQFPEGWLNQ